MNDKLKHILSEIGFREKENKWIAEKYFYYTKYTYNEYMFLLTIDKNKVGKIFLEKDKIYIHSYKFNTFDSSQEVSINLMVKDLLKVFYKELRKYKIEKLLK